MCGIYGWQLDDSDDAISFDQRYALAFALASYNDTRGGHSYGYAIDGDVFKGLGRAIVKSAESAERVGDLALATTLVGHARYATTGAITTKNAHPFKAGRVVGAHNGVVYNHAELNEKYNRRCAVDSQHLFRHLNEGRKLDDVRAYGAVEYWMAGHPHTVRIGRFNDGVLSAAQLPFGVVWSSTRIHLEAALLHAGVDHLAEYPDIREGSLYVVRGGRITRKAELNVGERYVKPAKPMRKVTLADLEEEFDAITYYEQRTATKRGALYFDAKLRKQDG